MQQSGPRRPVCVASIHEPFSPRVSEHVHAAFTPTSRDLDGPLRWFVSEAARGALHVMGRIASNEALWPGASGMG
jgi:hypothetical protein